MPCATRGFCSRVGWSACENMMSGVVVVDGNAGSLTAAAIRGGDMIVKGRVGARTGIDQKGGTVIVLGDAGSMTGFMMQRGRQIIVGDVGNGLAQGDRTFDHVLLGRAVVLGHRWLLGLERLSLWRARAGPDPTRPGTD